MSKFGSLLSDVAFTLEAEATAVSVKSIPLARIKPDPKNPRTSFDPVQLEELAESIKVRGVLQPITVRAEEGGTSFVIRYGERRWRAAGIAGLSEIKAIVTDSKADENDLLDQVIENDQREDLSAAEMGRAVAGLLRDGLKATEIARRLGRPKSVIAEYAALQEMPSFLQGLADTIPIGTIYPLYLAWKTGDEQAQRVEAFVNEKGGRLITRAEARSLAREASGKLDPVIRAEEETAPPLPLAGRGESSAGRTPDTDQKGVQPPTLAPAPVKTPAPVASGEEKQSISPAPITASGVARADAVDKRGGDRAPVASPSTSSVDAGSANGLRVMVAGRPARLILPEKVQVVYDDDGSEQTIALDDIRLGEGP